MKNWPKLTDMNIMFYLLKTKACDLEDMNCYKSLDSYNYLVSGLVGKLTSYALNSDFMYIKAIVGASLTADKEHSAWASTYRWVYVHG